MGKRRKRNKVNATGRNATTRFVRLDHRLLTSSAYRALTPTARCLLVEISMLYNGENNGSLYLSVRDATDRLGLSDMTSTTAAFNELQELGFIEMTNKAHFVVKSSDKSRARTWRLTWEAGPGQRAPSHGYDDWEPVPGTKAQTRMERGLGALKRYRRAWDRGKFAVLDSDTLDPFRPPPEGNAVLDSHTAATENRGVWE